MKKEKRTYTVSFKATKDEKERIDKLAAKEARTVSDYCRREALRTHP